VRRTVSPGYSTTSSALAIKLGGAVIDRRWIRWPLFAVLLFVGIIGGVMR
jgi:hypothetical protein